MTNKKIWITVTLLSVVVLVGWKVMGRKKNHPQFKSVAVEKGNLQLTIMATGVVQPQNRVEIKPPIAGRAEEILVQEGQAVKKGQILAWMSSVERAALLDAARAKGAAELKHWEDLYKPAPLVAPLAGIVIARNVEPGQTVAAADAVLVMSNRLIVKAQVDETDIAQVKLGQKTEIILDAFPQNKISSLVDHVAYEAQTVNNVTVYEVDIVPEQIPDFMRSGMTANATFLVAQKDGVLLVPSEAVRQEEGRTTVLVPNPEKGGNRLGNGLPKPQEIRIGLSDGKKTEILEGLAEGALVMIRTGTFSAGNERRRSSPLSPMGGGNRGGGRNR